MSWQGLPRGNIWHWFSSKQNVFISVSVQLNSNGLCTYNSTNFTKKVKIKRICRSKMHKIKAKRASKSSGIFTRSVKHLQPQCPWIWCSNWATEITLKANEANYKNETMFRLSQKSAGIKSKNMNKPNQTRNRCVWGYHSNDDRCFCLDTFMLMAAKQVSNKSVSSSNPCSLSNKDLLNTTSLQLTPWLLCINIMMWLHLSHCFNFTVVNAQTLAWGNQYLPFL